MTSYENSSSNGTFCFLLLWDSWRIFELSVTVVKLRSTHQNKSFFFFSTIELTYICLGYISDIMRCLLVILNYLYLIHSYCCFNWSDESAFDLSRNVRNDRWTYKREKTSFFQMWNLLFLSSPLTFIVHSCKYTIS